MIRKILVANRGLIACRIMRTCREMGITTAAIYTDLDYDALHVRSADEAVKIEGETPQDSYLDISKIVASAQRVGADAIHPGYGLLAEDANFVQAVIDAGLHFIGPSPTTFKLLKVIAQEKFIDPTKLPSAARRIQIQIFGDHLGNVIAIGERESSLYRHHQSVIAETPSTLLTARLRATLFDEAVNLGTQVELRGAASVNFLVDSSRHFALIGMTSGLTLEHAITEETTGFDLVRWQIMVSEGFPLPDMDVYPAGHAIEAHVFAENPSENFAPSTGSILRWQLPGDIRINSAAETDSHLATDFATLLCNIVAYGEHRHGAIRRLTYALSKFQAIGVHTNTSFLRHALLHSDHLNEHITGDFIQKHPEFSENHSVVPPIIWIGAACAIHQNRMSTHNVLVCDFKTSSAHQQVTLTRTSGKVTYALIIDTQYTLELLDFAQGTMTLVMDGYLRILTVLQGDQNVWWVHLDGCVYKLHCISAYPKHTPPEQGLQTSAQS